MSIRFIDLMYPPESGNPNGGNTGPASGGKEDIIEFLGDDEPEPETIDLKNADKKVGKEKGKDKSIPKTELPKDTEEDDEVTDDEDTDDENPEEDATDDELEEIEAELEGPTDEQLELVTPVRRREILKKYPQLFKDFPYLEKAYYREQQFTELLPTIQDAKEAVESAATLSRFERDLMGGNTETILKAVKAENIKGFHKLVDDYLPTLARVDEAAYHHVLGNVLKHTIYTMVKEGRESKNEALTTAAQILNQFVTGSSEYKPPTKLSKDDDSEGDKKPDDKLTERERNFTRQAFETTRNDLNTRVNNVLKATISAHLDPKNSMSDYVKKNASREAIESLEGYISKDSRFTTIVDKLWERAFSENFSKESVDRIKSAYLTKAKTLLPAVIKKARNEALKGIGKRVRVDDDVDIQDDQPDKKGPVKSERPRSQVKNSGKIKDAKDIPKGMRTLDFLNAE